MIGTMYVCIYVSSKSSVKRENEKEKQKAKEEKKKKLGQSCAHIRYLRKCQRGLCI
jgi:hypothetical protein